MTVLKKESGQALVLVLLSLAVVLTIVLYVLARSVTDVAVSSRQEDSVRAFSAAEAGIERALVIGSNYQFSEGGVGYTTTIAGFAEGTSGFVYPIPISSGDTATIWFVAHNDTGEMVCDAGHPCFTGDQIKLCWGKPGTPDNSANTPAIELSVFYESVPGSISSVKIARVAFDPNSGRASTNSFASTDSGSCQIDGQDFSFQKTISLASLGIPAASYQNEQGLQFAKVRMLYNSDTTHQMAVSASFAGNSNLPSQGQKIVSEGTSGDSTRKVEVFQGFSETPSIFGYSIYSTTGLVK